jgi:acetate kinase
MASAMGGLDAVTFTGSVDETAALVREDLQIALDVRSLLE